MRRTILEKQLGSSVSINGLIIRAQDLESTLLKHCTNLAFWNDSDEFPISIPGSATLLKYRNHFFHICTRHQTKGFDLQNVSIMLGYGQNITCVTSSGARWYDQVYEEERHEILLSEYTEPCLKIQELRSKFFDFRGQLQTVQANSILVMVAFGYPSELQKISFADNMKMQVAKQMILCDFEAEHSDPSTHVIKPRTPLNFNPDGLSGGPVFCILAGKFGFELHFVGIIVRGTRERLQIIKAGAVQNLMNHLIGP